MAVWDERADFGDGEGGGMSSEDGLTEGGSPRKMTLLTAAAGC